MPLQQLQRQLYFNFNNNSLMTPPPFPREKNSNINNFVNVSSSSSLTSDKNPFHKSKIFKGSNYQNQIFIIQANLRKSKIATEEMSDFAIKNNVDFILVQEPSINSATGKIANWPAGFSAFYASPKPNDSGQKQQQQLIKISRPRAAIIFSGQFYSLAAAAQNKQKQNFSGNIKFCPIQIDSLCDRDIVVVIVDIVKITGLTKHTVKKIALINIYFGQEHNSTTFLDKIQKILNTISVNFTEHLIIGMDSNAHSLAWFNNKSNERGVLLQNFIIENNCCSLHLLNNNRLKLDRRRRRCGDGAGAGGVLHHHDDDDDDDENSYEYSDDDEEEIENSVAALVSNNNNNNDHHHHHPRHQHRHLQPQLFDRKNCTYVSDDGLRASNIDLTIVSTSFKDSYWSLIDRETFNFTTDHTPIALGIEIHPLDRTGCAAALASSTTTTTTTTTTIFDHFSYQALDKILANQIYCSTVVGGGGGDSQWLQQQQSPSSSSSSSNCRGGRTTHLGTFHLTTIKNKIINRLKKISDSTRNYDMDSFDEEKFSEKIKPYLRASTTSSVDLLKRCTDLRNAHQLETFAMELFDLIDRSMYASCRLKFIPGPNSCIKNDKINQLHNSWYTDEIKTLRSNLTKLKNQKRKFLLSKRRHCRRRSSDQIAVGYLDSTPPPPSTTTAAPSTRPVRPFGCFGPPFSSSSSSSSSSSRSCSPRAVSPSVSSVSSTAAAAAATTIAAADYLLKGISG